MIGLALASTATKVSLVSAQMSVEEARPMILLTGASNS